MSPLFQIAFPVLAVLNLALALWVLLHASGSRSPPGSMAPERRAAGIGMQRVWAAVGAVLLANTLEMGLLSFFRLHLFGAVHVAWLDVWLVAPVAGLGLLLARARGRTVSRPALAVATLALVALPLGVYSQWVEPFDVRLERAQVSLPPERAGHDELLVAVLADIQSTRIEPYQREAVAALMAARPDLILIPGDVYQGPVDQLQRNLQGFRDLIGSLHAPGGVWVVPGNADLPGCLPQLLEGTGARLLRDEMVHLRIGDRRVTMLGLDEIPHLRYQVWRDPPPVLQRFLELPGDDDLRLLLSHRPRIVNDLPANSRCDLVISGHTHGGQVALPFIGPLLTLSPLPREVAAGGLHELSGNRVYISRGLGMERLQAPRIRLGAPPELTLLRLGSRPDAKLP